MYSQLPMFHRIGAAAYKANLDNTLELDRLTGNPHRNFLSVHVAGTNGKGSVSHMIASIFQEAGLKTGLFTSPHLVDFRERIKINGEMVPEEYVIEFLSQFKNDFQRIQPSFFEMTFAMAMSYFSTSAIDIAVIETGLGGRLDSTNIITPLLSVITNIGLDHVQFLGDTHEAIAHEKAGIIKPGMPVVIGETHPSTKNVFIEKSKQNGSVIEFADQLIKIAPADYNPDLTHLKSTNFNHFRVNTPWHPEFIVDSPLLGNYQIKNIATVLLAIEMINSHETSNIKKLPKGQIPYAKVLTGIRNTVINTKLQGRWQVLAHSPLTVCDIGHNTHGLKEVVNQIGQQKFNKLHFVLGVVNDKDLTGMLQMLPKDALYYFCKADIPRGLDAAILQSKASEAGLHGEVYPSVADAFKTAVESAEKTDMVFVGGSAFTVAEVLSLVADISPL